MKRGISLIAVLMFMLAATTASIVIFKWIGSENFSSGARLKASEAYQASESGIDYVRSWMENKAADVGALVTQYYATTNPKPPIKIFENVEIGGDKGQKFSAYMIGIDATAKPILKLKILVEGKARDSSRVFQTAILSTDGLYKVFVPDEVDRPVKEPDIDVYFGSSVNFQGEKTFASATVNGNWTGNPPTVTGNFIITGNLTNSGSKVIVGGNACVGGEYKSNNDSVSIKGGLYMGSSSEFVGTTGSYQDVYCDGDMKFGTNGVGEMIKGSLTINGKMSGFNGGRRYRVDGSLVLGDDPSTTSTAYIDGAGLGSGLSFVVCDSVWTTNPAGVRANTTQGEKIKFNYGKNSEEGCPSKSNAALFFKDAKNIVSADSLPNLDYKTGQTTPVGYFKSKATANTQPTNQNKPAGASSIKALCMGILGTKLNGSGCDGSNYKVSDPIVSSLLSIENFLEAKKDTSSIKSGDFVCLSNKEAKVISGGVIKEHGSTDFGWSSNHILPTVLNDCYDKLQGKPNMLYGGSGGYLVVKINQDQDYNLSTPLKGKFIFIYEKQQSPSVFIAPTTNKSKVMIFFKGGIDGEMKSAECVSDNVCNDDDKGGSNCKYNYFIYSLANINKANTWNKNCPLAGNIFFPSNSCARLVNADNNFSLESNKDMVKDLAKMGILCETKEGVVSDNCEDHVDGPPPPPDGIAKGIQDTIWIPIASRLPIKLEGKEIRKELLPANPAPDILNPSILVMPRAIRLTPGQVSSKDDLKKYYNYLYLNYPAGITPTAPTNIDCDDINFNAKGKYTCTISKPGVPPNVSVSPFYVIVGKIGD